MAEKELKVKLTQLVSDFEIKSKELMAELKEYGIEKKSGASLDREEFDLFLDRITAKNQISNLDAYCSGEATITVKSEKKTAAKAEMPKAEAPKAEAPKAETPKAEAPKAEAPKAEAPKTEAPKTEAPKAASPGAEAAKPGNAAARPGAARPAQSTVRPEARPHDRRPEERRSYTDKGRYNQAPQANPFAKNMMSKNSYTPEMIRKIAAENARKNANAASDKQRREDEIARARAEVRAKEEALRRAEELRRKEEEAKRLAAEKAEAKRQADAESRARAQKKKEEKRAQKQTFKTITPTFDKSAVKGGVNVMDNAEITHTMPKTRVVDTRTVDVNLSKYDDHFNDRYFAIANGSESASSKQKLQKKDTRSQGKSAKDKERAAQEKIKRLEAEKARRKQLEITVPDEITVGELSSRMKKTSGDVIKKLMLMGVMKSVNDTVDYDTAEIIADEFGIKVSREVVVTIEERLFTEEADDDKDLIERSPVVCVMGHVDHGKTSILDAIRHTSVTSTEAGGITQAIGAYRVNVGGKFVTFLDTPGHEAFTAMRMRGAQSTDIAILVVAADDGIMPQTVEAINHAKAAGIDIIVAINKIDKPQANPDMVMNELTQYNLVPEAWGGDVICVPVSALTGQGIQELLESVLLVAEVKELRANPNRRAKGIIIESKLDRGRGPVATVLVQNGTLHQGDYVIAGTTVGRVRAMTDDTGNTVKEAGPSVPVEIIGLDDVPQAGDELNAVEDEKMARNLAQQRQDEIRQQTLAANSRVNLDDLFTRISEGTKELNIIVKADVAGSAEAVKSSLLKLSNDEVKVSVIHAAAGGITESDVMLASASNAIIVGFNVRPDKKALDSAERNNVDIRTHRIIYEIIDEVEAAMKGMLAPTYRENLLGHAVVRQTIHVPAVGTIAGSYVQDGKVTRSSLIRIVRDGVVIFEDKISSLRRFKDDVREVASGYECGIGLEKFNDIKEGDILEAYVMEEVER